MAQAKHREPAVTIEELEEVIAFAAFVVLRYGEVYAPLLDRLESELIAMRRAQAPRDRARQILETYTRDGGAKAIASSH